MRRRRLFAGATALYALTWTVNRSLRRVEGPSMRPTLAPGDLVLVAPTPPLRIRRGSVVLVRDPRDGRPTIKRVAALAGEHVRTGTHDLRAGARQVVVLGDDPSASTDSRVYGPVAVAEVRAVALVSFPSLRRLGATRAPSPGPGTSRGR